MEIAKTAEHSSPAAIFNDGHFPQTLRSKYWITFLHSTKVLGLSAPVGCSHSVGIVSSIFMTFMFFYYELFSC